jgi:predicted MFS family arabinose efflux permease
MSPARRQVALLASGQALLLVNNVTLIAVNGLAGAQLARSNGWSALYATLPVTAYVLGGAAMTMPASFFMQRWGRRAGFTLGAGFAIAGSLLAALAVNAGSMWGLCGAVFLAGFYNAFGQYFRFAAADAAMQYEPGFKERAISLVLAGGIAGGVIGPELSKLTRTSLTVEFAGSYLALAVFAMLSLMVAQGLRLARPVAAESDQAARPLSVLLRQPTLLVAMLCGMIAYGVMSLLMTTTPLAMQVCGWSYNDAAFVLEWHVIGMFAPGFFTGSLNQRLGTRRVMLAGAGLLLVSAGINLAGTSVMHFWAALALLGVGWNFMFTGATSLLTTCYRPSEKAKVQGFNDLLIFLTMITSSFSSGVLLFSNGWWNINLYALPVTAVAIALLWWQGSGRISMPGGKSA